MKSASFKLKDDLFIHINLHRQPPFVVYLVAHHMAYAYFDEVTT